MVDVRTASRALGVAKDLHGMTLDRLGRGGPVERARSADELADVLFAAGASLGRYADELREAADPPPPVVLQIHRPGSDEMLFWMPNPERTICHCAWWRPGPEPEIVGGPERLALCGRYRGRLWSASQGVLPRAREGVAPRACRCCVRALRSRAPGAVEVLARNGVGQRVADQRSLPVTRPDGTRPATSLTSHEHLLSAERATRWRGRAGATASAAQPSARGDHGGGSMVADRERRTAAT